MRYSTTIAAAGLAIACAPAGAGAQAVLDWPLALEARPAVLVTGSGAALGNPAGLAEMAGRAEGLVSDLETPDEMSLHALSLAGAVRLFGGWIIGVGYRHIGVDEMLRTDGPPIGNDPLPTPTLEVSEDVYSLGVAVSRRGLSAGIAGRLDTPADELGGERAWAGTGGVSFVPPIELVPIRVAAFMEVDEDDPAFAGALEVGAPLLLEDRLRIALAYGARHDGPLGFEHAIVGTGVWRGIAELQMGAVAQPGVADAAWVPLFAGLVHLGRYRLGIVREHLPNGFGAAMHYRLSVLF